MGLNQVVYRLVFHGLLDAVQTWSCSFWVAAGVGPGQPSQADLDAYAHQVNVATQPGWIGVAQSIWSGQVGMGGLTVYRYEVGTTKSSMVSKTDPITVAGQGASALPPYCSMVASLRTGTPGRSGRGRVYLPFTLPGSLEPSGQLAATQTTNLAGEVTDIINEINGVRSGTVLPNAGVVSVASFTKGVCYPVTEVVVNSVPDVQHRRTDQLIAAHTTTVSVT